MIHLHTNRATINVSMNGDPSRGESPRKLIAEIDVAEVLENGGKPCFMATFSLEPLYDETGPHPTLQEAQDAAINRIRDVAQRIVDAIEDTKPNN